MEINYNLSHRLIVFVLFVGLLLQSCSGNVQNQVVAQEKEESSKTIELLDHISEHPLINPDKGTITSGSYLASFYKEGGQLKTVLKANDIQPKPNYKSVPIVVEAGTNLTQLAKLGSTTEQQGIRLLEPQNGEFGRVTIFKGDNYQENERDKLKGKNSKELLAYAENGNCEAQFKLGERSYEAWRQYYQEADLKEAKKWLVKAATQGHKVAIDLLEGLNLPPLVEGPTAIKSTGKGKEKESNSSTYPIITTKSISNKETEGYFRTISNKELQESNQQQELKERIISQLAQTAYYQRIKLELHKHLLSPSLSQIQQTNLSAIIKLITAPERKLRLGASYETREDFRANPYQEHNLFEPLRVQLQELASYKQEFLGTPIEVLLEELIVKHQAFIASLTEEVKRLGLMAPLKLFEAKPLLLGEGFNCYEVETNKAYQLACYNPHEYEYVRSNPSGLSIGSMHGGVYFKVDNGTGLLRPAKEHAVYSLYQALGLEELISPTHLVVINDLSVLPPDIGASPERRELQQKKQEFNTPSSQKVFNHYPELEQKIRFAQQEWQSPLYIQGSLIVPGKTLEKFLEEAEADSNRDSVIKQLEPNSFSGHILASLLLMPTDYKPDNLMVDEQYRIIGIDNDAALEASELRELNYSKAHGVSIKNILYFLPCMQSPITTSIRERFIKHHSALLLLNWLLSLQKKQASYNYLLTASSLNCKNMTQVKRNAEESLVLPLNFVPGWITGMYERFMKMQILLKKNPRTTHQDLFEQIHPFASRYYKAVKKLHSQPLDQIAFIYEKLPTSVDKSVDNNVESLLTRFPELGNETLFSKFSMTSFAKKDPSLTIEQAIQELIANTDLKSYSTKEQLDWVERVIEVDIWPSKLHLSWYEPRLLIRMVQENSSNRAIKMLIEKVGADIHVRDETGSTVLHTAVRRGSSEDTFRQLSVLVQLGADIEAQEDQTLVTPLDIAAEKKELAIFKYLVNLGAGAKAMPNKINSFYQGLRDQEKKELNSYVAKLTHVNPKVGWEISLNEIFPLQNRNKKSRHRILKTVTEGNRIISDEAWNELFEKDGSPRKTNSYGVRFVPFIEKNGQKIYVKFLPQLPGTELAVISLAENLLGYCAPYCELASIENIPVLLTQGIPGETLYEVSKKHPEKLNQLDPDSVSKALILAMLINPGDGNLGNYILSPFTNPEGQKRYRLISIDNDQAFMPAVAKSTKTGMFSATLSLQVKTILYCLEAIKQPVSQEIVDKIKNADLLKILENWLNSLKNNHEAAKKHFDSTVLKKYQEAKTTVIGISFAPGMIKQLFSKLMRLQTVLNKKTAPTHLELLATLEPMLAHRYRPVIQDSGLNLIEKFKKAERITDEQALTSSSNGLPQLLLSRDIPLVSELQSALFSGKYGPDQALKELQEVKEQHTKAQKDLKDLAPFLLEIKLREMNMNELSLLQQKTVLEAIKDKELRYINLKECNVLTNNLLINYFKIDHIKKLDLSGCTNLGNISSGIFKTRVAMPTLTHLILARSGVSNILLKAEQLKKLNVHNCVKLKSIDLIAPQLAFLDLRGTVGLSGKAVKSVFKKFANTFIYLIPTPNFPKQICANYLYKRGTIQLNKSKYELAAHCFKQAANQGNVNSQYRLGWMYGNQQSVPPNYKEALTWYQKAADQGHVEAQCELGTMYAEGKGIVRDYQKALIWYKRAAEQGYAGAQCKLGAMYAEGKGVEKDNQESESCFKKALDSIQKWPEGEKILTRLKTKNVFSLYSCNLDAEHIGILIMHPLFKAQVNSIHRLNLSYNQIGVEGASKLAETLINLNIHTLDLYNNQIGAEGASKLAKALTNTNIHILNLSHNQIGAKGASKLAKALPNTNIHTLDLSNNKIGVRGISKLAEALTNTKINTLDLSNNQIGAEGVSKLALFLSNSNVHILNLGSNQIGSEGASKLAEAITVANIRTLNLWNNQIGSEGTSKLALALPYTNIHTLDLGSNQIGSQGVSKLTMILTNTNIHMLDLSYNQQINLKEASKLGLALNNTKIHAFNLIGNQIGVEIQRELRQQNPNIKFYF